MRFRWHFKTALVIGVGARCSSCVPPIRLHGMQCSCLFSACMSISQYNVLVLDLVPVAATGGGGAAPYAMNCNQCITGFPDTPQRLAHMATSIGVHQSKHFSKKITKNTRSEATVPGTKTSTPAQPPEARLRNVSYCIFLRHSTENFQVCLRRLRLRTRFALRTRVRSHNLRRSAWTPGNSA